MARIECGESVIQICKDIHISERTFYAFKRDNEEREKKYARAKEQQADYFCEEIMEIADNSLNDWVERENAKTGEKYVALNNEALERSKIRIEARKWTMGKNKRKKYGDNVDLTSKGEHVNASAADIALALSALYQGENENE
jgi:hypothetical protein